MVDLGDHSRDKVRVQVCWSGDLDLRIGTLDDRLNSCIDLGGVDFDRGKLLGIAGIRSIRSL